MKKIRIWIEAMRLRTLPVSVAGVIAGIACALMQGHWRPWPAWLCVAFAVLAQIASNFANEYYDFKAGLDKPGREGPRRGVTEGDLTPAAMRRATYGTLAVACLIGLSLIAWSGWWLIFVGVAIALGVLAYSTGPYPLSRHGLGEVAVIFFFGLIPVNFTYYLQAGSWSWITLLTSMSIGLMGANVLIINNYRDRDDDSRVGKHTLAVILGRKAVATIYLLNGLAAVALMAKPWMMVSSSWWIVPALYVAAHTWLWLTLPRRQGAALTPLLGITSTLMLLYSIGYLLSGL